MKATLSLLVLPATLLVSCSKNQEPVAPPVSPGDPYGVPGAQAPYQPIDPINPPAAPVAPVAPANPVPAGVPAPQPVVTTPASPDLNGNVYTIQDGDSLWGISRKFNTTVEELKQINGLTGDTIIEGRTLIIPGR